MAHFAEIDSNNIVIRVIVVSDDYENIGSEWCHNTFGGTWIQTSYNEKIRKNYASIGYYYDAYRDIFIPPQPFISWIFDEQNSNWKPPIPYPDDNKAYHWNESIQNWELLS